MCICSWKSLGTRLSHDIHSAGSHIHLITLVGVHIGEQEVLEQDRATLCKLLSSLFAAAEKTTESNFLLGKHWSSYQYFQFVWCEGSKIQCNKASKWCSGIFLDICDRGMAITLYIRMLLQVVVPFHRYIQAVFYTSQASTLLAGPLFVS